MIDHIVIFTPVPNHDADELANVMAGLADLIGKIDGFTGFSHGANIDLEGKSPEMTYGFVGQFRDQAALENYATDPRHQALGGRLVALCQGGGDGIVVYDLDGDRALS